ncbi:putative multidrug resistance protein [Stipitochalara longipes BDJ]|nr:putative multidrug resistance protein [Stipitochalara longipes BDJ]
MASPSCLPKSDDVFGPIVQGCRSNFDFTLLFEQTILSIGPAALLLIFAPPRVIRLLRSPKKTLSSRLRLYKTCACIALVGVQLGLLICWSRNQLTRAALPSGILSFLAGIALLCLSRLEHSRAIRPSSLLNIYLLASLSFDAVQVRTLYLKHVDPSILGLFTADVVIKLVLLLLESKSKRLYLKPPYNSYSPETTSGIFNRGFFWWLNPVVLMGFRKILTLDDLFTSDLELLSEPLLHQMQHSWNKYKSSGKHALTFAVFHCLRWSLASIFFPRLCLIGFNFAQPFLLAAAIDVLPRLKDTEQKSDGYGLIGATGLIYLGIAIFTAQYQHRLYRSVTMFRGAIVSLIYAKTLKMRAGGLDESAALTLMSTDIDRLTVSLNNLCEIWAYVIEMAIGIWLLERQIGWICVAPVVLVIVSIYAASKIAAIIAPRQKVWVKAIQQRVSITSSMLGSMKSVKLMGLSDYLFESIQRQRVRELDLSKKFRILGMSRMLLSFVPSVIGPLAVFVIFAIQASVKGSDRLSISQTFSSLVIVNLLTIPAENFLQAFPLIAMSVSCLERIQGFLLSESCVDDRIVPLNSLSSENLGTEQESIELSNLGVNTAAEHAILIQNIVVRPSPDAPPAINDVSLSCKVGSLTMVIGVVGSGKSTLLKAIAGELNCSQGSIMASSKHVAYCSQAAWLPNATVRNIVCGYVAQHERDEAWYESVLHACAFDEDVRSLPQLDDTVIGSRGVVLSGGQKQRLALARALYSRQRILILDDILSAIDAKTEALVVERLIGGAGLLKRLGSTVILATHAVRHLPLADNIIVLEKDGKAIEQGKFVELRARAGFVSRLVLHPDILDPDTGSIPTEDNPSGIAPTSLPKAFQGPSENDIVDLARQTGDISVYKYYLKSIGWKIALLNAMGSLIYTFGNRFPSIWLNLYAERTIASLSVFAVGYVGTTIVAFAGCTIILYTTYMNITPKSGAGLHKILLRSVLRAPQSFFDRTDSGVTLNRFSQDMTLIDGQLPAAAVLTLSSACQTSAQFGLVAVGSSYMALTCPVLLLAVYFLQKVYLRTSRQMRFLDLECKSPLYTHFAETIEGVSTIRAFGWQEPFMQTNLELLDASQKPYYLMYCIQRWLNLVLQLIVGFMAVAVVALALNLTSTTSAGRLGVSMSAVVAFSGGISYFMQFWTQLETSLGAVARVKNFEETTIPEDKEQETFIPGGDWPRNGAIEFKNVSASYGSNAPALRDISLSIKPGEKIGICGRTGSGKSSLLSVLLRILDMESGTITIDGVNLQVLPREIIRSRLVTIPQDPFILSGSVRLNADPTSSTSDELIIAALTKVGLWSILSERGGLDAEMTANPLSQGEQQIFCLARAMLKTQGRILVLDEATSNVDAETDQLMQRLIREEFKGYTIITVAHRLDTILDSDRIVVLEAGRVVEVGAPHVLLGRPSAFRELRGGRA